MKRGPGRLWDGLKRLGRGSKEKKAGEGTGRVFERKGGCLGGC